MGASGAFDGSGALGASGAFGGSGAFGASAPIAGTGSSPMLGVAAGGTTGSPMAPAAGAGGTGAGGGVSPGAGLPFQNEVNGPSIETITGCLPSALPSGSSSDWSPLVESFRHPFSEVVASTCRMRPAVFCASGSARISTGK